MKEEKQFDLIIVITNQGYSEDVMAAAKSGGATGGTILSARGTGMGEIEKFFGIMLQKEKEILMIVTPRERKQSIMQAVCRDMGLHSPAQSVSFAVPVEDVAGLAPF